MVTVSDVTVFLSQAIWSVSPTLQCGLEASGDVSSRSYLSSLIVDLTLFFLPEHSMLPIELHAYFFFSSVDCYGEKSLTSC